MIAGGIAAAESGFSEISATGCHHQKIELRIEQSDN
jgi:hypothetical protein